MSGLPSTTTRQRKEAKLGGGTTAKLGGGPTARRSGRIGGTTRKFTTMGGTTSQSHRREDEDMEYDERTGLMFSVKPMPLFVVRSRNKEEGGEDEADAAGEESKAEEGSQDAGASATDKPKDVPKEKLPDASMQSGLTSSLADTSEDEAAKAEAEAAKNKGKKKDLTAKELDTGIDICLMETVTQTLF